MAFAAVSVGAMRLGDLWRRQERQQELDVALQGAMQVRDYAGARAIAAGASADAMDTWAMFIVIGERDPKGLKLLLDAGADANAVHDKGGTAIGLAAASDAPACVMLLLEAGADPTVRDFAERNALDRVSDENAPLIRAWISQRKNAAPDRRYTRIGDLP